MWCKKSFEQFRLISSELQSKYFFLIYNRVQVTFNGKIGEEGFENKSTSGDPDEEQIFLEESWPHI